MVATIPRFMLFLVFTKLGRIGHVFSMKRSYETIAQEHFSENRQMLFLAGPRQVGKTTTAHRVLPDALSLNWDKEKDRELILSGQDAVREAIGLQENPAVIFDEIHKYPEWKNFLKGFFDTTPENTLRIMVTGSARLDTYRKGADSLMGRFFLYRMHPLSVREIVAPTDLEREISDPVECGESEFSNLLEFGGFPEPFMKANRRFYTRWRNARQKLLFREDIRDLFNIHEMGQVEVLAELVRQQTGQLTNIAALARKIRASEQSIRRWISVLKSVYYCFSIQPWHTNVARSLLKEPKLYLWDWSAAPDEGSRNENFIASHILKAVHAWGDAGLGDFGLHYLRTKDKREVDFLVSRDDKPWFIVEVKTSEQGLSPAVKYFYDRLDVSHAFQVIMNKAYVNADCFVENRPIVVPARTFVSQLI